MVIKSFGKITDIIPNEFTVTEVYLSWEELKKYLFTQYPTLANEFFLIAVNNKIKTSGEDFSLRFDDVIALMPPFSGG